MGSTPTVKAPPKRSYLGEMQGAVQGQMAILPQMLEFEKMWMGRMQENQLLGLQGQMRNQSQAYMEGIPMMQQGASAYNQAMVPLMNQVGQYGTNAYMNALGGGAGLLNTMSQQAQMGLNSGSFLSDAESTYAQQAARAAMSARGLTGGNQGIANEILNSYSLQQAREDRNRQYAQQVLGLQSNVANMGYQQYGQGMMQNIATLNPMQQYAMAGQMQAGIGPQYLRPESQMSTDINTANQNMAFNVAAANAANAASRQAAIISGVSNIAAAAVGGGGGGTPSTPTPPKPVGG